LGLAGLVVAVRALLTSTVRLGRMVRLILVLVVVVPLPIILLPVLAVLV
jgi:hypothetical protein